MKVPPLAPPRSLADKLRLFAALSSYKLIADGEIYVKLGRARAGRPTRGSRV